MVSGILPILALSLRHRGALTLLTAKLVAELAKECELSMLLSYCYQLGVGSVCVFTHCLLCVCSQPWCLKVLATQVWSRRCCLCSPAPTRSCCSTPSEPSHACPTTAVSGPAGSESHVLTLFNSLEKQGYIVGYKMGQISADKIKNEFARFF